MCVFPNHTQRSKMKAMLIFSLQKWRRGLKTVPKALLTLKWYQILPFYIWELSSLLTGDLSQRFMFTQLSSSATHALSYPSHSIIFCSLYPSQHPPNSSRIQQIIAFPLSPGYYHEKFKLAKNQDETNISGYGTSYQRNVVTLCKWNKTIVWGILLKPWAWQ